MSDRARETAGERQTTAPIFTLRPPGERRNRPAEFQRLTGNIRPSGVLTRYAEAALVEARALPVVAIGRSARS
jgi:hypothetical protein